MRTLAIAGTGTEVGKTYVTARLRRGLPNALALKPVESGYIAEQSDARAIADSDSWTAPLYHFEQGLSPHQLARQAGVHIESSRIKEWLVAAAKAANPEWLLVETAGGLLTPLDDAGLTNLELARRIGVDGWILVAANRLGVLHDVSAALCAAQLVAWPPRAVVLSGSQRDLSSDHNTTELERLVAPLAVFEVRQDGELPPELIELLLRAI